MADGQVVVCNFSYLSLMFIFKLATKQRWMIIGNDRSADQEVSRDEIETRYGSDAPSLGLWDRFGLLMGIAALVVIVLLVSAF